MSSDIVFCVDIVCCLFTHTPHCHTHMDGLLPLDHTHTTHLTYMGMAFCLLPDYTACPCVYYTTYLTLGHLHFMPFARGLRMYCTLPGLPTPAFQPTTAVPSCMGVVRDLGLGATNLGVVPGRGAVCHEHPAGSTRTGGPCHAGPGHWLCGTCQHTLGGRRCRPYLPATFYLLLLVFFFLPTTSVSLRHRVPGRGYTSSTRCNVLQTSTICCLARSFFHGITEHCISLFPTVSTRIRPLGPTFAISYPCSSLTLAWGTFPWRNT